MCRSAVENTAHNDGFSARLERVTLSWQACSQVRSETFEARHDRLEDLDGLGWATFDFKDVVGVRNEHGVDVLPEAHRVDAVRNRVLPSDDGDVVSERLGHANIAITLDTFSHVLPRMDEAAAATFGAMLRDAAEG